MGVLILVSGLSFLAYGIAYFASPKMKQEFIRFGLKNLGALVAVLEILGGTGLLIGMFFFEPLVIFSAAGLASLMALGVGVRIKVRDTVKETLPAFLFFVLNLMIVIGMVLNQ
jgi:uncharacterized membrane protein YphA (DoxX/SURF4 family)